MRVLTSFLDALCAVVAAAFASSGILQSYGVPSNAQIDGAVGALDGAAKNSLLLLLDKAANPSAAEWSLPHLPTSEQRGKLMSAVQVIGEYKPEVLQLFEDQLQTVFKVPQ
jgi:hypothetical protein